jgi:hypothetical protein
MKTQIEKSSVIRRVLSIVIVIALVSPIINAQAGKTNFSGNWVLNQEKSTMPQGGQGGGPRMMGGGDFAAAQEANLLTVDRTRTNQNGETMKTTMKYTLDGKESINASQRGDSKSVATWSPNGKDLTIVTTRTFDMNGETRTMKTTELWTLTAPNQLTVTSTFATPNGDMSSTFVYDKK